LGPKWRSGSILRFPGDELRLSPYGRAAKEGEEMLAGWTGMLSIVVVIPLYNGGRWVERALWSAINQTRPTSEIVVVDDGSTDGGAGAELVRRVADQSVSIPITLLQKPNGGQSSARNHGVVHSKGDLIALLDQDDVWYPHHVARLVAPFEAAEARPGGRPLGWTYSDVDLIDELGDVTRRCWHQCMPSVHPKKNLKDFLECDADILPSASLISRTAFERIGGFDERLVGYEDDDLFVRLFQAGFQFTYVPQSLSQWRVHSGSSSHSPTIELSRATYANKLLEIFPEFSQIIRTRFVRMLRGVFINALKAGDAQALRAAITYTRTILPGATGIRAAVLHFLSLISQYYWLAALAGSRVGRHVIRNVWKLLLR
jgi:GT2 family glycosyltransferase